MKKILLFFCLLSVLFLWLCAASVYVSPAAYGRLFGVLGLLFPFGVAATAGMWLICLLFSRRLALIPLFGLLACCGSLRDYCPINLSSPPPKGCLKVMTYNVMCFNQWAKTDDGRDFETLRYLCAQQCDLIAIQEALIRTDDDILLRQGTAARRGYVYEDVVLGINIVGLLSRYPVVKKEVVCHSSTNGAAAFYVCPAPRDTIIVVNAHLESMHLSSTERAAYHTMVKNPEQTDSLRGKLTFLSKIANSSVERACQADTLAQFIDFHKDRKLIVMGDFNDTPISYAHHEVCRRLTDTYRATGNGLGRSFHKDAIVVRIDNIFCSARFKPFAAAVDPTVTLSDHYPLTVFLKENK